jgi:hypothetical protein
MDKLTNWLGAHEALLWWTGAVSVLMFVATLILVPIIVTRIPPDYFIREPHSPPAAARHPAWHWLGLILKNFIGVVFVLAGIAMLVLPGQGLITILIGLTLINFPGKFKLQQRIVRQSAVFKTLNWMRGKAGRPPLQRTVPNGSRTCSKCAEHSE